MTTRRATRTPARWLFAALAGVALLAGCRAPMALLEPPPDPPADFGLAVRVFPGEGEPVRYILEPGGSLRAATGAASRLPPIVRTLDARARARLWDLTLATGAHDPAGDARVHAPELFDPRGEPATLVTVAWGEGRSAAAFDPGDPAARALTDELADLAWVER